jgi:hypothetical protein
VASWIPTYFFGAGTPSTVDWILRLAVALLWQPGVFPFLAILGGDGHSRTTDFFRLLAMNPDVLKP